MRQHTFQSEISSYLEDPVIAVLPYKAQKVDTPGVHQLVVGRTCHSTRCLCNAGNNTLTIHLQMYIHRYYPLK